MRQHAPQPSCSTPRSTFVIVSVAFVLSFVPASCGSPGTDAAPPATVPASSTEEPAPPSTTTSSTQPQTEEEQVLATVDGYMWSTLAINDPPNPGHPDLERYRAGELLEVARAQVLDNRSRGIAFRLPPNSQYQFSATVLLIEGNRATVRNCVIDDAMQVTRDGMVLDADLVTKLQSLLLERVDGAWKVVESNVLQRWEGVGGCAAAPPSSS